MIMTMVSKTDEILNRFREITFYNNVEKPAALLAIDMVIFELNLYAGNHLDMHHRIKEWEAIKREIESK